MDTPPAGQTAPPNNARKWARVGLWLLAAGLVIFPPFLVIYERWLGNESIRDVYRGLFNQIDWLRISYLPTYFVLIIPAFILFLVIFLLAANPRRAEFGSGQPQPGEAPPDASSPSRRRAALFLAELALAVTIAVAILAAASDRLPGIELALAVLLFLFALRLVERPLNNISRRIGQVLLHALPLAAGQLVLILFLRNAVSGNGTLIPFGLLLGLSVIILLRTVRPPPVYWVVMGMLALMCYRLSHWQFAVIGDEYSFFNFARFSLEHKTWAEMLARLFDGLAVYESHPFFSSLLQISSMALFGRDNFGWRFSSIYLAATSLFFFYAFFRIFLPQKFALWAVIFLGASHYLMTFGKIGYNNLQALFAFGLVLWTSGRAVRDGTLSAFAAAGAAMGLCFYLYPASLYAIPVALVLLLFYAPPNNRPALSRWLVLAIPLAMMVMPLLFQPAYWQAKLPGTLLHESAYMGSLPLAAHLGWNFIYALFSYLYTIQESHYVFNSHLDPLSGTLFVIGLAWTLRLMRGNRFAAFLAASYLVLILLVGVSHDRFAPPNTRMFMLLPWLALFAALGLGWLASAAGSLGRYLPQVLTAAVLVAMLALNVHMAYTLTRQRTVGVPSLEVLFMRLLQRERDLSVGSQMTYLFLTSPDWDIGGIREMQQAYGLPASQAQLQRVAVDSPSLPEAAAWRAGEEDTLVIIQPWMNPDHIAALHEALLALGKRECPIRDAPGVNPRFSLYLNEHWQRLCPLEGHWQVPPLRRTDT